MLLYHDCHFKYNEKVGTRLCPPAVMDRKSELAAIMQRSKSPDHKNPGKVPYKSSPVISRRTPFYISGVTQKFRRILQS